MIPNDILLYRSMLCPIVIKETSCRSIWEQLQRCTDKPYAERVPKLESPTGPSLWNSEES